MATIMRLGAEKPVVIFTKSTCCMCHAIETLIKSYGADPRVYEIDKMSNGQQIEKELHALLGRKLCVPAVIIGNELIGGDKEVMSLHVQGELPLLLIKAKAIWVWRSS